LLPIFYGHSVHFTVFCYGHLVHIVHGNSVHFLTFWYFVLRKIWQPGHPDWKVLLCLRNTFRTISRIIRAEKSFNEILTRKIFQNRSKTRGRFRGKKLAFFSKTNVTINFLHNLALFVTKNAIFWQIFRRKYLKNHNTGPRYI
jgi:hypothetical protein